MGDDNLLLETIEVLNKNGKSEDVVLWVGKRYGGEYCSWEDFKLLSEIINYDSGFGSHEILSDLVVVGEDWWLSRWEYDGSEGWQFNTLPIKPGKRNPNLELKVNNWW